MPVLDANEQRTLPFAAHKVFLNVAVQPPGFSEDAIKLLREVWRIRSAAYNDLQSKPSVLDTFNPFDEGLDADVDMPLTKEFLAAQHREFLANNKREWLDIDLPLLP